jgi:hypothetical protein
MVGIKAYYLNEALLIPTVAIFSKINKYKSGIIMTTYQRR